MPSSPASSRKVSASFFHSNQFEPLSFGREARIALSVMRMYGCCVVDAQIKVCDLTQITQITQIAQIDTDSKRSGASGAHNLLQYYGPRTTKNDWIKMMKD